MSRKKIYRLSRRELSTRQKIVHLVREGGNQNADTGILIPISSFIIYAIRTTYQFGLWREHLISSTLTEAMPCPTPVSADDQRLLRQWLLVVTSVLQQRCLSLRHCSLPSAAAAVVLTTSSQREKLCAYTLLRITCIWERSSAMICVYWLYRLCSSSLVGEHRVPGQTRPLAFFGHARCTHPFCS